MSVPGAYFYCMLVASPADGKTQLLQPIRSTGMQLHMIWLASDSRAQLALPFRANAC